MLAASQLCVKHPAQCLALASCSVNIGLLRMLNEPMCQLYLPSYSSRKYFWLIANTVPLYWLMSNIV